MACLFADSFDVYGSSSDMLSPLGPWSLPTLNLSGSTQFTTGQAAVIAGTQFSIASFATSETTIYGTVRAFVTGTSSASNYWYLSFTDTGTAQTTIRWNTDGSIGLYSGGPTGTLLQTYSAIFTANVWNSYQFKVVINNSTGSIEIRMNGAATNVITKTGVNTRAGTSNSTANGIGISESGTSTCRIDDLFVNNASGNAPTSWPGDLRSLQQYPTTATSSALSVFPTISPIIPTVGNISTTLAANTAYYAPFPGASGTLGNLTFGMNANFTGNIKFAIYDNSGTAGAPGAIIATSNAVNNPTAGLNTATFASPPTLVNSATYYLACDQDGAANALGATNLSNTYRSTTTYASFPPSSPTLTGPVNNVFPNTTLNITSSNAQGVGELLEDADATYVFSSSTGEDKYAMSQIPTSYNVVMVQPFMMYKRTDVGPRTLALSLTANGSADTAVITDSSVGNMVYNYRFANLELDPTGVAWTPTSVNGAILGLTGS
jgi:hypothetical protein